MNINENPLAVPRLLTPLQDGIKRVHEQHDFVQEAQVEAILPDKFIVEANGPEQEALVNPVFIGNLTRYSRIENHQKIINASNRIKNIQTIPLNELNEKPFEKGWLKVNEKWLYIDYREGKIGFFQDINPEGSHFIHTTVNDQGEPIQQTYYPAVKLYKVKEKGYLKDLVGKLKSYEGNDPFPLLERHLKLKKLELPSPKKAPHFYLTGNELTQENLNDESFTRDIILRINLCEGENLSRDVIDIPLQKLNCFSNVNRMIDKFQELELARLGVGEPNFNLLELKLLRTKILNDVEKLNKHLTQDEATKIHQTLAFFKEFESKQEGKLFAEIPNYYSVEIHEGIYEEGLENGIFPERQGEGLEKRRRLEQNHPMDAQVTEH